jgi:hypothetical protein
MFFLDEKIYYLIVFIGFFIVLLSVFAVKQAVKKNPEALVFGFKLHRNALKIIVFITFFLFIKAILYTPEPTSFNIVIKKDGSFEYIED